ncbi:MAG: transglutaminase domain-containing protein [Bacteroidota bacterium]
MRLRTVLFFWVSFTFFNLPVFAKYEEVDRLSRAIKGKDLENTHKQLEKIGQDDEMKARAFFTWITENIRYDVVEYKNPNPNHEKQQAVQVFKNKKGVCEGYSNLFKAFCELSGIACHVVGGHCRELGKYVPEGHAWNTVMINGDWRLVDVTWGAGVLNESGKYEKAFNESYFFTPPTVFIEDHYAFDPAWQLVHYPVKLSDYRKPNWKYQTDPNVPRYNYADTIVQWLGMDTTAKIIAGASRVLRFNYGERKVKESVEPDLFNLTSNLIYQGSVLLVRYAENNVAEDLESAQAFFKIASECISLMGIPSPHLRKNVEEMKSAIKEYSKLSVKK